MVLVEPEPTPDDIPVDRPKREWVDSFVPPQPSITWPFVLEAQTTQEALTIVSGVAVGSLITAYAVSQFSPVAGVVVVAVGAVACFVAWWRPRPAILTVDEGWIRFRPTLGRKRAVPGDEVAQIVLRVLAFSTPGRTIRKGRALVLDRGGRCVLRLSGFNFSYEQLCQLAAVLQVRVDRAWTTEADAPTLARQFPGSVAWVEAHPFLAQVALVSAFLALLGAAFYVLVR
jgi:hypothetical protein